MNKLKLGVSLFMPLFAGAVGSFFTTSAIDSWYQYLIKPSFSPPNWIFGPVWTLLYVFMGIALYFVWQSESDSKKKKIAISVFAVQLVLNVLWSALFFGLGSPFWAFVEIIFLWIFILTTLVLFGKIKKSAGWLLLPYLLWVSFAAVLNFSIWQLN